MTKITWFINLFFSFVALTFIFYSALANTAPPILVDQQSGKYLGNLSANPCDPNSTSNPYGKYGSEYSADSINNHTENMALNTVTIVLITPMLQIHQRQ